MKRRRTIYRFPVEDTQINQIIGIKLPFNSYTPGRNLNSSVTSYDTGSINGTGVFSVSYTTEEQAISNLKNLLLTSPGERVMLPNFGTRIREFVFEQITNSAIQDLRDSIEEAINFWLPYIIINEIDIQQGNLNIFAEPAHGLRISINVQVTENGANRRIILFVSGDNIIVENE